jgi:pimeloyl-ACP methyl ester carboxylesterase
MAAMPTAPVNGIEICYDTIGDPSDPSMLLVMGLGSQLIHWDAEFCRGLAARGFHVVRFDNRDVGLSSHLDARVDLLAVMNARGRGAVPRVPYLLSDMAADAVGLLDHLGVEQAHLVGVSLGGMIAQTIAIAHPERVRTLTSVHHAHVWGSPGHLDDERLRRIAGEAWDRAHDSAGVVRQLAAIMASGSRSAALARLAVPTLVIHGTADTLVQPSGGERTAEVVPDAKLLMVDGMGHDLAPPLWPELIEAITAHAAEHG